MPLKIKEGATKGRKNMNRTDKQGKTAQVIIEGRRHTVFIEE